MNEKDKKVEHMSKTAFTYEMSDDMTTFTLIMKANPGICCMECLFEFLETFLRDQKKASLLPESGGPAVPPNTTFH